MRFVWWAILGVSAVGCGDDTSLSNSDGADGQTDGGAGGIGIGMASAGGAGGAGAVGGGALTGGGGGERTGDTSLLPLAVGNTWTYQVTPVGGGSVCAAGTHTSEVVGQASVQGKDGFTVTSACSGAGSSTLALGDGDEVFLLYQGQWLTMIATPVQAGHTWSYFNSSYTWQSAGTVVVPAGTFDDCWTARQNVSYTAYITYCPGVGMVQNYSSDLVGSGWDMQLSGVVLP